ncbi:MAG: hypothetical protein IKO55_02605 [Kiritimatiellae bacterium]|nr:hypothetical protein [Kiritimatiellia bacterium]
MTTGKALYKKTAIISAVLAVAAVANAAIVKEYERVDGNKSAYDALV